MPTAKSWISAVEASYIIFLLQPHFSNFNKRLTKSPKLYFYDTGIACSFLGIEDAQTLHKSPFRGSLFENYVIADFIKQFYNKARQPSCYFWRDQNGRIKIDCVVARAHSFIPIEIKSSQTIQASYFDNLLAWNELSTTNPEDNYIIYAGDEHQRRSKGMVMGWKSMSNLISKIIAS